MKSISGVDILTVEGGYLAHSQTTMFNREQSVELVNTHIRNMRVKHDRDQVRKVLDEMDNQ